MEAENATRTNGWVIEKDHDDSNTVMVDTAPRNQGQLDFTVTFSRPGNYFIWFRHMKPPGAGDKSNDCFLELDGQKAFIWEGTSDRPLGISTHQEVLTWQSRPKTHTASDRSKHVYFKVPAPGTYVLSVRSRSPGYIVDKICLIHEDEGGNEAFPPILSGTGPEETIIEGSANSEVRVTPPPNPTDDATPRLVAAVDRAISEGAERLVLAPGTYQIHPTRAAERYVAVSNHDDGLRRTPLPFWHAQNLIVEATGARLILHGQAMIPLMIHDAENLTIRGLEIDWARPLHTQGQVVSVNPGDDSFEVEFLPECGARILEGQVVTGVEPTDSRRWTSWQLRPWDAWRQNLEWNYWMDPASRTALPPDRQLVYNSWNSRLQRAAQVEPTGPDRFRFYHAWSGLPQVGEAFVAKGMLMANRLSPAIHVARSRRVTIEDVVVRHAAGMGYIAESSTDLVLRRYRVSPSPDSRRLISTTADGSHFNQCSGQILVEDSLFENMLDDAINVHGSYALVEKIETQKTVILRLAHFQQLGLDFVRPGEKLRFSNEETLLPLTERVVQSVRRINEECIEVGLEEALPPEFGDGIAVDNLNRQPNVIFRRNVVRNNRGRGVLATTEGTIVIEDNRFEKLYGGAAGVMILFEGDTEFWHESGPVRSAVIRRNTFIPIRLDTPVIKLSPLQPGVTETQAPYHRNIAIKDNVFQVVAPRLVVANRVAGLSFSNNTVVAADPTTNMLPAPAFVLRDSQAITINDNRFELPTPAWIEELTPTLDLLVNSNTGLGSNQP